MINITDILLAILITFIFTAPLKSRKIEKNLELFLLICGLAAMSISWRWTFKTIWGAVLEPVHISALVFTVGIIFKRYHRHIRKHINIIAEKIGIRWTMFLIVLTLGLTSSLTTAIVSALILSEIGAVLCTSQENRVKLVVYTCFAISAGAVLTPVGEPLATIVLSKLSAAPHHADNAFIFPLLGPYIFLIVIIFSVLAYKIDKEETAVQCKKIEAFHSFGDILLKTGKVYIFVMGLIFLGEGLKPLAYKTIYKLSPYVLYWVNIISASLDNATLAAVEIVPEMPQATLTYLLVSLIIGGGMLIPANIPNIISAQRLNITSKEWARIGMPIGLIMMAVFFVLLLLTVKTAPAL